VGYMDVRRVISKLTGARAHTLELCAIVFLWQGAVGIYLLSLVQQYLPQELRSGPAWPGYAMAAYGTAKFLWNPAAGWVADRIGRRLTMVIGMALSVPVLAGMMESGDERTFLALSAVLGIGAATMWPAFMAHVGDSTPHARRTRTMTTLNLAQMAGLGAGTAAGVVMVDYVTYGAAFWMCIGFSSLALLFVLRNVPHRDHEAHQAIAVEAPDAPSRAREGGWTPSVAMLGVIVLFLTLGTSMHTPMIGAYTQDVLRVKMSHMALFFPLPAAAAAIFMWKMRRSLDAYGRHVPLIGGLFVAALSIFALTLTRNPFIAVNLVVLAGVAYAVSMPAWGAAALDATDAGSRGLWLGALSAVQGIGVAGGQALGGVVGGIWGPLAPFKIAALMLTIALALIVGHFAAQRRREGPLPAFAPVPVRR